MKDPADIFAEPVPLDEVGFCVLLTKIMHVFCLRFVIMLM